jgi:lysophospholipase L1-like esterase
MSRFIRIVFCLAIAIVAAPIVVSAAHVPCNFNGPDSDGTNRDDLAVYYPPLGNWYIRKADGPVIAMATNWGFDGSTPVPGDYDGDGVSDMAVFYREQGTWYIRTLAGSILMFGQNWGWGQTVAVPGDYDGDGRADMAVYDRMSGNWFIKSVANDPIAWGVNWGFKDAVPVPGDYNGDGTSDLAVFHRATGNWYIRTLSGQILVYGRNWGWKKTWPVSGDFNGDGASDLAVYHRVTGNWYIQTVGGQVVAMATNWGFGEATPIAGDFDGDRKSELAVYHKQNATWYIRTLAGQVLAFGQNWGFNGAVAIQGYACPASEGYSIVCFGDSITWGDSSELGGPLSGYPMLLEKKLYNRCGGYFNIHNAGVSGDWTSRGVKRLPTTLDTNFCDEVLLMEGMNDALLDSVIFEVTGDNLFNMVGIVRGRGLQAVIATIPPAIVSDNYDRYNQHQRIIRFNPGIWSIASAYRIPVADVYDAIVSKPNWETELMDWETANHPNDAGYRVVRDTFFDVLQRQILIGDPYW